MPSGTKIPGGFFDCLLFLLLSGAAYQGSFQGIYVWKLWNIRASKELKEQIEKIKIEKIKIKKTKIEKIKIECQAQ